VQSLVGRTDSAKRLCHWRVPVSVGLDYPDELLDRLVEASVGRQDFVGRGTADGEDSEPLRRLDRPVAGEADLQALTRRQRERPRGVPQREHVHLVLPRFERDPRRPELRVAVAFQYDDRPGWLRLRELSDCRAGARGDGEAEDETGTHHSDLTDYTGEVKKAADACPHP